MHFIKNIMLIVMLLVSSLHGQEEEKNQKGKETTDQTNVENEKDESEQQKVKKEVVEKQEMQQEETAEEVAVGEEEAAEKELKQDQTKKQEETAAEKTEAAEEKEEREKEAKQDEEEQKKEAAEEVIEVAEEEAEIPVAEVEEITPAAPQVEIPGIKPAEQIAKEVEEVGIDTIDIEEPQGNWLFKRMWWEHAEDRYEKIRDLVQKIWESRMSFFIKRNELDKMILDPFYISIGLGQGELQEIVAELVGRIEKEQQETGTLNQSERALLNQLQAEKQTLEQTKLDVESISQLDQEVNEALNRLMEQINRVRIYEQESWEDFKDIARVLNDKKARELFFKIDTALRNVKSIEDYLQQDFTKHFNQLLQQINEQVGRVADTIQRLKEKGIDFKKQLDVIEEEQPLPKEEEEKEEEEVTMGWGSWLWNKIVTIVRWPYDKLVGTNEPETNE